MEKIVLRHPLTIGCGILKAVSTFPFPFSPHIPAPPADYHVFVGVDNREDDSFIHQAKLLRRE